MGFSYLMYSVGFVPISTAAQLYEGGAPWSAHGSWACLVVLRNMCVCALWYSAWHYALYVRRVAPHTDKFNPDWETGYLYYRDRKLALAGSLVMSCYEVAMIYMWASARVPFDSAALLRHPAWNLFWATWSFWWSDVHFWLAHRVMHPWFMTKHTIDPGALLYRSVHALHHKSHNPGPWSGLAMHPVEHLIYFTRALYVIVLAPLVVLHPVHFLTVNLRAMIGPALGHHGFSGYFGYKFHYLHHAKFEVNYGTSCVVPIDCVLGTFSTGGVAQRRPADTSFAAWFWLVGAPYLGPLALLASVAHLCGA